MLKEFSAALCAAALLTVITPVTAADTVSQPVVTNEATAATANETANGSTTSAAQDPVSTQRVLIAVPNSNRQLGLDKTILTDFVTRTKALFPYPAYGTRETNTGLYPTQVTLAKLANDNDADIVVMPAIKNWTFRTIRPRMDRYGNGELYTEINASISLFVYDKTADQLSEMTSSYHALNQSLSAKSEGEVLAYLMMHLQRAE
ncbi:hypothetical protein [uncultured Veillonella sp.]|uniref:hypothetical protein n=1 Tax=uncultured Veillonella sp. TaxID=159268 RepID=UPI0025947380|nr:hypothetical protein [uncultured Veillonella sp.]